MSKTTLDKAAKSLLETGICSLIGAFNLANEREWTFAPEIRGEVEAHIRNLMECFFNSEIMPAHATKPHRPLFADTAPLISRQAKASAAQLDLCFQRFMQQAQGQPPAKQ